MVLESLNDFLSLVAGTSAQNMDNGLFVGAETFHGFVQNLGVVLGVERVRRMNSRILGLISSYTIHCL